MKIPGSYQDDMWMWDNYLCSWRSIQLHNLSETMNMAQRFKILHFYWIVFSTFSDMFSPFLVVNTMFFFFKLLFAETFRIKFVITSSFVTDFHICFCCCCCCSCCCCSSSFSSSSYCGCRCHCGCCGCCCCGRRRRCCRRRLGLSENKGRGLLWAAEKLLKWMAFFFANPSDPDMNRLHFKYILVSVTQLCATFHPAMCSKLP